MREEGGVCSCQLFVLAHIKSTELCSGIELKNCCTNSTGGLGKNCFLLSGKSRRDCPSVENQHMIQVFSHRNSEPLHRNIVSPIRVRRRSSASSFIHFILIVALCMPNKQIHVVCEE